MEQNIKPGETGITMEIGSGELADKADEDNGESEEGEREAVAQEDQREVFRRRTKTGVPKSHPA